MAELKNIGDVLWLIPVLPLLAAAVIGLLGPGVLRKYSHWPCLLAFAGAFVVALLTYFAVEKATHADKEKASASLAPVDDAAGEKHHPHPAEVKTYYPWIQIGEPGKPGSVDVGMSLRADALSAMMMVMVTFIALLIAIYACGYMAGDPGYARFFMAVSLFVFSMSVLVLGDNLILLFFGWEGVGLCSYLLIGHWLSKPEAAEAARKAFLVNRIGDIGLMLGILLLWYYCGSFAYGEIFAKAGSLPVWAVTAACLLLFCGAMGKSAQFPLHVWLPDAMEGPTPVSALIHAATMVTAGVYLVARFTPLFLLSPDAQLTVGVLGGVTAFLSALMALTQNDLKRVLAYSTLSQLGYMFMALGAGVGGASGGLVTFAVVAAMFHLFTHAFFKALLFLGAGSVMHSMGHVIDMRRFSGLAKVMPITHVTFLVGALALAGFPLLSGFWSKDEILVAMKRATALSPHYGWAYSGLWLLAMATVFLTGFYTFRAYFKTFWGPLVVPPEADAHGHGHDDHAHDAHGHADHGHSHGSHGHKPAEAPAGERTLKPSYESPPVMTIPLIILAVFAAGVGLVLGPAHYFAHFLEASPAFPDAPPPAGMDFVTMAISSAIAILGIGLAYYFYVVSPATPKRWAEAAPALYQLSYNKFYFDEIYAAFIVAPLNAVAYLCRVFDYNLVDGLVDVVGNIPRAIGYLFRPVQNGLVQFYALAMVLALSIFLMALVRSL